ncbi:MAG: DUF2848 domain-containing protein [Alkalilacustris sp.]
MPVFHFDTDAGPLAVDLHTVFIAGWTGRDAAAVRHHIEELAALGVPPPSRVPLYYRAGAELLTQADGIAVLGPDSSGEVEPLLVADADGTLWLGLASDHTDRALEAVSVAKSKQICPKPIARTLWRLDSVADRLDALQLRSEILEPGATAPVPYQEGTLASILPLPDLIAGLPGGRLAPGTAMLCGTLTAIGGIRPATRFTGSLHDPVTGRTITLDYAITPLDIVA